MIELNLTYEESKKIFELGYDFSKICDRFFIKYEGYRGNTEGYFFKMNDSSDMFPLDATISTYDEVWDHGISLEHEHEEVTPIIPKAALEACLPDINPLDDERLPDLDTRRLKVFKYHTDMCDREHEETIKQFNSAFEAFIWCHEYYPEELRKKFDEVMG